SRKNSEYRIHDIKFQQGIYIIEVSIKDKDNQEVKNIKYVELYDDRSNGLIHPGYLWTQGSRPIEPGEKTTITLGSSADIVVIQQIDKSTGNREQVRKDSIG